jgi:hypothetical protein
VLSPLARAIFVENAAGAASRLRPTGGENDPRI